MLLAQVVPVETAVLPAAVRFAGVRLTMRSVALANGEPTIHVPELGEILQARAHGTSLPWAFFVRAAGKSLLDLPT